MSRYKKMPAKNIHNKKLTQNHTSLIPIAVKVLEGIGKNNEITKISPGFIKAGLRSTGGKRRIKINKLNTNCILLSIRGNTSHQEITIYSEDIKKTSKALSEVATKNNIILK